MEEHSTATDRTLTAPLALEYIKDNGGCTLAIVGDKPIHNNHLLEIVDFTAHRQAYSVAMFHGDDLRISNYLVCDDDLLHMIIRAFMRWVRSQSSHAYFGAWVDGDDLVLDAALVYIDDFRYSAYDNAMHMAMNKQQDAIYDLIECKELRVEDYEPPFREKFGGGWA